MNLFPSRSNPLGRDWSELDERARNAVIAERESDLRRMKDSLYAASVSIQEMDGSMPVALLQARRKMLDNLSGFFNCPLDEHLQQINVWSANYRIEWMKHKSGG